MVLRSEFIEVLFSSVCIFSKTKKKFPASLKKIEKEAVDSCCPKITAIPF